jgi:hypothetical protein
LARLHHPLAVGILAIGRAMPTHKSRSRASDTTADGVSKQARRAGVENIRKPAYHDSSVSSVPSVSSSFDG